MVWRYPCIVIEVLPPVDIGTRMSPGVCSKGTVIEIMAGLADPYPLLWREVGMFAGVIDPTPPGQAVQLPRGLTLGRRALLRLARPQSASGQGLRGNRRLGNSLPLCRFRPVAHTTAGSFGLRFESDSRAQIWKVFVEYKVSSVNSCTLCRRQMVHIR